MTTPEHTLVGIHTAFACGCHRRWGWTAVVMAAVASNIPDWDGLPMLIDMQRFESGHRVWGHNFLAIVLGALLMAWLQRRYRWMERVATRLAAWLPVSAMNSISDSTPRPSGRVLFMIAFVVQAIHLPCDMVVSGGQGLSDWLIYPFWPFWNVGYVFPLIPWGDVGPTVITMAGIILCAKMPQRSASLSVMTLIVLCVYLLGRGYFRGTFAD